MPRVKAYGKNSKNGATEKIHGKKVKVGKGTGEKVAKRATGAIKGRQAALKDLFPDNG